MMVKKKNDREKKGIEIKDKPIIVRVSRITIFLLNWTNGETGFVA